MESFLKKHLSYIRQTWFKIMGYIFTILSVVLSFVTWEDVNITNISSKILVLLVIVFFSLIIAIIYIYEFKTKNTIMKDHGFKLNAVYGNIMDIAFPKSGGKNKIVVISVNTCFDTLVDEDISKYAKPLVSAKSIHGMWIKRMRENGINSENLDKQIRQYLNEKGIKEKYTIKRDIKKRGNLKSYENGTIAMVKGKNNVTFFLLVMSEYDENNKASSDKESIIISIKKLIDFYDQNGQGYDLYIPLIGTGLSRTGLTHEEALETIKSTIQLFKGKVHGEFNIVIYDKDRDKVSIFD